MMNKELLFRGYFIDEAKRLLKQNPSAIQITILETVSGEMIPFFLYNLNDNKAEEDFFEQLRINNKVKINHIIAMWSYEYGNNAIEMPKGSILKRTDELDPYNHTNTCVLVYGDLGITGSPLSRFLPPSNK